MFYRKIIKELEDWKKRNETNKKGLIIKGLRQVGKTTIIKYFIEQNYESIIYLNFKDNPEYINLFDSSLKVDDLKLLISAALPNIKFVDRKTVLFLDEIQECAKARSSIKNFCLDGRYDVICSGSLLGIKGYNRQINEGPSTGYEEIIEMKAMDFEEFLLAIGINNDVLMSLQESYNNKTKINETLNNLMINYFKQYICVGGMPAIVNTFITTKDFNVVLKEQRNLIESFKSDFAKHINEKGRETIDISLLNKINTVFESIPNQLAKKNNKFIYKDLGAHARKNMYETAIDWLISFGLIVPCFNLDNLQSPLEANKNPDNFKLYFADTGLFISQLDDGIASNILNDSLKIYKGAIYENIVAEAFYKNNKKLYYYRKDSGLEIDFVSTINNVLSVIEVKAKNARSKSLNEVLNNNRYDVSIGYKLINGNIDIQNKKIILPQYLTCYLK